MDYASNKGGVDKSSAGREGGKFLQGFPKDSSSHKLANCKGKSMGGSITNLSHSISGSANQKGPR